MMKKRQMIKIGGWSVDGNPFESTYLRKQLNYYFHAIRYNPKFFGMVLVQIKSVELGGSPSFRVAYRLFKRGWRDRRELQKSLKMVINYLVKDYDERNNN